MSLTCPICGSPIEKEKRAFIPKVMDGNDVIRCSMNRSHKFQRNNRHPIGHYRHNPKASLTNMDFSGDLYVLNLENMSWKSL